MEKLAALNIDIYHYEDIVRCYALAKLNIEHSRKPDYTAGIHTAEFDEEVSRYQLLPPDAKPYYDSSAFFSLCSELAIAEHVNATNESLSDFIRRAITETMERDKASEKFDLK